MKEKQPVSNKAVIGWAKHFSMEALEASNAFFLDFRIGRSLHLSPEQTDVFMAYFAHYWVLKKNIQAARMARNPMSEQMLKFPILRPIAKYNININDGVNLAGKSLLELALEYSEKLKDGSSVDLRNAANILSSIYLEGGRGEELNQKMDRALGRIKIGKDSSAA